MPVTNEQNQLAKELGPKAAQLPREDLEVWAQEMYQELKNVVSRCQVYRRELLAYGELHAKSARYFLAIERNAAEAIDPGFTDSI